MSDASEVGRMVMWTVYQKPKDFPHSYVARMFEITADGSKPTQSVIVSRDYLTIEGQMLAMHLTRIPRDTKDEPQIVETWL